MKLIVATMKKNTALDADFTAFKLEFSKINKVFAMH